MGEARFVDAITTLLNTLAATQGKVLDDVAAAMAGRIHQGGLVHLFGSGHSVIPVLDAFPRYGSFVGLHPLTDPRLMWSNVLGPGGVRPLLWLERTKGYIERYLGDQPLTRGDVLIVFSHGGKNAAPVEAATYARSRGLFTVGVTSIANHEPTGEGVPVQLADVVDTTIDTGVPAEDALVSVPGWGFPVAGASTILGCAVVGELVSRTAAVLAAQGVVLPTFVSPTVPGASVSSNDHVFRAHRRRVLEAAAAADAEESHSGEAT